MFNINSKEFISETRPYYVRGRGKGHQGEPVLFHCTELSAYFSHAFLFRTIIFLSANFLVIRKFYWVYYICSLYIGHFILHLLFFNQFLSWYLFTYIVLALLIPVQFYYYSHSVFSIFFSFLNIVISSAPYITSSITHVF